MTGKLNAISDDDSLSSLSCRTVSESAVQMNDLMAIFMGSFHLL